MAAAGALAGCAHALKKPPTLEEIAGPASPGEPTDPTRWIEEAKTLFEHRDVAEARRAATLALRGAAATTPPSPDALLLAIRILVWLTEHEEDSEARGQTATRAVQAAQYCDAAASPAPCAYWKAAALGQQARERPSTGLSAIPLIEAGFKEAVAADASLEQGGPDRALALFYLRAPGWPSGPGDPEKGLEHARRAVALGEDHAPNHLALAEALAKTGDAAAARREYARARALALRAEEAGDPDAGDWMREAEEAIRDAPGR
jgi:Tfp pilus assembly protein PilF